VEGLYSRRSVVTRGSGVVAAITGAAAVATPGWAKKRHRKKNVWRLDPDKGRGCKKGDHTGDCSGCRACHHHAKNKRFATHRAANRHRAHRHCKCKVVQGGAITRKSYVKLFGEPGNLKRASIDLRHPAEAKVFNAGREAAQG
jgi:hypothetical protein